MNLTQLAALFQLYCEKHKQVLHSDAEKHFFRDVQEAMDNLKGKARTPIIIMGPPDFTPSDKHTDNQQQVNGCSLVIVDTIKNTDIDSKFAAYDKCKTIAEDFISKIKKDAEDMGNGIIFFDIENSHIEPTGPVLTNYYGTMLMIEFHSPKDYTYNAAQWKT